MYKDKFKDLFSLKAFMPIIIGSGIFVMITIITVIVTTMQQREQLYLEGAAKAVPLVTNDKMKYLGDLYVKLENDFDREIKEYELGYANRANKRGDKIYYGVNGKENITDMINDDYVNGINVKYIKGNAIDRPDGDSNFVDMMAFLTATLGAKMDEYSDEELEVAFTNLFKLTHTFSGTSTELYPCTHGCAWCKYYCGDVYVTGEVGGNTVPFYQTDEFLGQSGKYGLMYDPFLIDRVSEYPNLRAKAIDSGNMATPFNNKGRYVRIALGEGDFDLREEKTYLRITNDDDNIFDLMEPDGVCEVCSNGEKSFSSTTRKFAGCEQKLTCYHGRPLTESREEGPPIIISMQSMGSSRENDCTCYNAVYDCSYVPPEDGEGEDPPHDCSDIPIGCGGYYECTGHEHYACPGHIIVCCFGHTNLNLEVKIMYYEEMIEKMQGAID